MLKETINTRIRSAMKEGRTLEKEILRVALGEIQTVEHRTSKDATDAEAEAIFRKLIKSNQETLASTTDAGARTQLENEIAILDTLLPKTLSVDEIVAALAGVADAIRAANNDGQATGVAMKTLKATGAAVQGTDVSAAVKKIRA